MRWLGSPPDYLIYRVSRSAHTLYKIDYSDTHQDLSLSGSIFVTIKYICIELLELMEVIYQQTLQD